MTVAEWMLVIAIVDLGIAAAALIVMLYRRSWRPAKTSRN